MIRLTLGLLLTLGVLLINTNSQQCHHIPGFQGVEDFVPLGKYLIASSDDRFLSYLSEEDYKKTTGKMLLIDTEKHEVNEMKIEGFPSDSAFHPHGIAIYRDSLLIVINHAGDRGGERLEVFNIIKRNGDISLAHSHSIVFGEQYDGMFNSLTFINKDEILLTHWLDEPKSVSEGLLDPDLPKQVTYTHLCSLQTFTCRNLPETKAVMNNGIAFDEDKKRVYIADTFGSSVRVFDLIPDRLGRFQALRFRKTIKLGYFPDNLKYDKDTKQIYIGAFKNAMDIVDFTKRVIDEKNFPEGFKAESGVLAIDTRNDRLTTLYTQDDFLFVSVGYRKGKHLFMGSPLDEGVYICML